MLEGMYCTPFNFGDTWEAMVIFDPRLTPLRISGICCNDKSIIIPNMDGYCLDYSVNYHNSSDIKVFKIIKLHICAVQCGVDWMNSHLFGSEASHSDFWYDETKKLWHQGSYSSSLAMPNIPYPSKVRRVYLEYEEV